MESVDGTLAQKGVLHSNSPLFQALQRNQNSTRNPNPTQNQVFVQYELDKIQNLKKLKQHLKRKRVFTRIITDDTNVRYEIHPAMYLEIKNIAKDARR